MCVLFCLETQSYPITPPRFNRSSFKLSVGTSEGDLDAEQRHELGHELRVPGPGCASHKVAVREAAVDRVRLQPGSAPKYNVELHGRVCSAFLPLHINQPTKEASVHTSVNPSCQMLRENQTHLVIIKPKD